MCKARARGLGVIFITHNVNHAYPVGDKFLLLNRGRSMGYFRKGEISREHVPAMMAGGQELVDLEAKLAAMSRPETINSFNSHDRFFHEGTSRYQSDRLDQ